MKKEFLKRINIIFLLLCLSSCSIQINIIDSNVSNEDISFDDSSYIESSNDQVSSAEESSFNETSSSEDDLSSTISEDESSSEEISIEDSSFEDSSSGEIVLDEYEDTLNSTTANYRSKSGYESHINLGSNITISKYEPDLSIDPYTDVDIDDFYSDYHRATSYEDAYFRSLHHLMSGLLVENDDYIPNTIANMPKKQTSYYRNSSGHYQLKINSDYSYEYISYTTYNVDETSFTIFYGGAYTSMYEVAAYLLAFGEVPANSNYSKNSSGKSQSISDWGVYGRVNLDPFSGNTTKYPYEPELKNITSIEYSETDFGTVGGYSNVSVSATYNQTIYNTGTSISRGAARFCYVSDDSIESIDDRYVFYTYNHYNDFQEYLNYYGGFGEKFGNESAGNQYCSTSADYYNSALNSPTSYPETVFATIQTLISNI